jgi:hypothetical protein
MSDESQMTKDELLRRLEAAWDELLEVLVGLDDAAKSRVNPESGWAIKDHLSHLAVWESGITYLLTGRPRHEGMGISAEQWRDLTMDEINTVLYQAGRDRSPAEAMAHMRMAHEEMLNTLTALNDADLRRDYAEFDSGERPTGQPIIGWIIGNTYEHYQEHLGYIREALAA